MHTRSRSTLRAAVPAFVVLTALGMLLGACASNKAPTSTQTQTPLATKLETNTTVGVSTTTPVAATTAPPTVSLKKRWSSLRQPLYVVGARDGTNRIFIVERAGRIRVVKNGVLLPTPFLDISKRTGSVGGEQGLLGLAFPANFAKSRVFYVDYTDTKGTTTISRFRMSASADVANAASETRLLRIAQPYANHNGGQLAFGPDGYLYIGMGDGGSAGDPQKRAQNLSQLLGKILRIDVTGRPTYRIPTTNPFVKRAGARPEIWARGVRNPWRFSFDRLTGDLYIADVGQDTIEEIDVVRAAASDPAKLPAGRNFGWSRYEGTLPFPIGSSATSKSGLTFPVVQFRHPTFESIVGGYVYRGTTYPALTGMYVYGDYVKGVMRGLRYEGGRWVDRPLLSTGHAISSFGQDDAGNLYLCDIRGGVVYEVID